jgi:hypothetical protein
MNASQLLERLNCVEDTIRKAKSFKLAVRTSLAQRSIRIFTDGKNTSDSTIGKYSEKPIYVNPNNSPKGFIPVGKGGSASKTKSSSLIFNVKTRKAKTNTTKSAQVFSNGKPHKTKYFGDGYAGFKSEIGRNPGFVNLQLFGNLKSNFENASRGGEPTKINDYEYVVGLDNENSDKRSGLENKYGTIFFMTEKEKQQFNEIASKEFHNEIVECFK